MTEHPAPEFENRIIAPSALADALAQLPRPLVFTNGCFDILHRGHVTYLDQARALGASMIVALNSDASVRRLGKAPDRPVNTLADRLAVMAALRACDYVTWFDENTPLELIHLCRPDILVKGGDWPIEKIVGAEQVLANGGQVYAIDFIHQRSTTGLINRIRDH